VAVSFVVTVVGGIVCGLGVGGGMLVLMGRTDDHLVEITFTTVAAYGSFLLAEHYHVSGVLATLTAGIYIGNFASQGAMSHRGRESVEAFWEYIAFVVNSLVFLLIGMRLAHQDFGAFLMPFLIAVVLVMLGRALAVYPCCALFARTAARVEHRHQHALFWGGLRGALALALVLGLPPDTPGKEAITTVAFAVVAFSIVVNGVTITPLLRWIGEIPAAGTEDEEGEGVKE
jgi:Na+:H+ antiporter